MDPIPDATTKPQLARQIVEQLRHLQGEIANHELIRSVNDNEETDPMTWLPPEVKDGEIVLVDGRPVFPTYGMKLAELRAAEARAWDVAIKRGCVDLARKMIEADAAAAEVEGLAMSNGQPPG